MQVSKVAMIVPDESSPRGSDEAFLDKGLELPTFVSIKEFLRNWLCEMGTFDDRHFHHLSCRSLILGMQEIRRSVQFEGRPDLISTPWVYFPGSGGGVHGPRP